MIARRRRDVDDFSDRARARLPEAEWLGPDELEADDRGLAARDRAVSSGHDEMDTDVDVAP